MSFCEKKAEIVPKKQKKKEIASFCCFKQKTSFVHYHISVFSLQ